MKLINDDLAPVTEKGKTWSTLNYFSLWVGMAVCIPSYMIASSLIAAGMSLWQAMGCVFLGNMIVLVPMVLNGMAGTKYGVPYPVFARASFGVLGSNVPALLRAVLLVVGLVFSLGLVELRSKVISQVGSFFRASQVMPL